MISSSEKSPFPRSHTFICLVAVKTCMACAVLIDEGFYFPSCFKILFIPFPKEKLVSNMTRRYFISYIWEIRKHHFVSFFWFGFTKKLVGQLYMNKYRTWSVISEMIRVRTSWSTAFGNPVLPDGQIPRKILADFTCKRLKKKICIYFLALLLTYGFRRAFYSSFLLFRTRADRERFLLRIGQSVCSHRR